MKRRPLIVGNWKMNGLVDASLELAEDIRDALLDRERDIACEVVICPPFTSLYAVNRTLSDTPLKLGAQTMSAELQGAHTGETTGLMLRDVGCHYVILGHSERRQNQGETDDLITEKVRAAFRDGLNPIACIGEHSEEREQGKTLDKINDQLKAVLQGLPEKKNKQQHLVIAYEPVWAIGTGLNATSEQICEVHNFVRERLREALDSTAAKKIRLLYGGSMKPGNAVEILQQKNVDGGLVGGASLKVKDFMAIIDAVSR